MNFPSRITEQKVKIPLNFKLQTKLKVLSTNEVMPFVVRPLNDFFLLKSKLDNVQIRKSNLEYKNSRKPPIHNTL